MILYMTHPRHGVHVVYNEQDALACEQNGWVRYGIKPPGRAEEPAPEPAPEAPKKKRAAKKKASVD